jgi:N6-L-threonylcarbamoyladenine synthase
VAGRRSPLGGRVILAVETSCDDTCVALISPEGDILANVISSQGIHDRYGGVVPEIASRHHLQLLDAALEEALRLAGATLDEVELVAATQGPGLVAALLVGFSAAKALAAARRLPFAPVDHLHGHIAASFLNPDPVAPPFLALLASGGHTLLADVRDPGPGWAILGQTLDDAAGEAFDKGARLLGLGYPGGPALQRLAAAGDPQAFDFPTAHRMPGLDFSFAGLKTALLYKVRDLGDAETGRRAADLAASYQRAIVEALTIRVKRALKQTGHTRLAVGGGVAANGPLREAMAALGVELDIPPMKLCTDNAAMIASAARYSRQVAFPGYLEEDVYATGEPGRRAA